MASSQTTHPFTCNTCQVAFKSSDLQRTHMQSDWHRYNLKRRVASLPPLSSEIFNEKVLASQADAAATAARALFERACEACQKSYYSENAFNNHLGSKKHKANLAKMMHTKNHPDEETLSVMSSTFSLGDNHMAVPSSLDENVDEDAEEEFNEVVKGIKKADIEDQGDPVSRRPTRPRRPALGKQPAGQSAHNDGEIDEEEAMRNCLFCSNHADTFQSNLQHMKMEHSLFIPEQKYLVDPEALITYLYGKVHIDFQCLYCNRLKYSEFGVKTHMLDKGHCKIAYETEDEQLEIGQFYDFRSTYLDRDPDDSNDHTAEEDDEGWETSSTASSVPSEELGKVYEDVDKEELKERLRNNRHHSRSNQPRHKSLDGYHSHAHNPLNAVYHDEFEIHLPSGRIAGHRVHNRYYKQNLRNYPTPAERADRLLTQGEDDDNSDQSSDHSYSRGRNRGGSQLVSRANGGLGMLAVSESKKREVKELEKRMQKLEMRAMGNMQWKMNKQGNKQKHYRDPLLQ
jgi:pre-60S factor REI1